VRTPLDKLDIDDATRKMLIAGGIVDVEGILEIDPQKLAAIVGSADTAQKLIDMAKRLLGSTPQTAPATTTTPTLAPTPTATTQPAQPTAVAAPRTRTELSALKVDAQLRTKLEGAGVSDVEGILEVPSAQLTEIVGDRAAASRLVASARKLVGGGKGSDGGDKPPRKKSAPKKRN
jgi:hypothetical protein